VFGERSVAASPWYLRRGRERRAGVAYVPGVATVPDTVDAAIAPEFDEVVVAGEAVVADRLERVLEFATRSWISASPLVSVSW